MCGGVSLQSTPVKTIGFMVEPAAGGLQVKERALAAGLPGACAEAENLMLLQGAGVCSAEEESGGGQGEAWRAEKGGGVPCYRDELCEAGRKPGQDRDYKPSTPQTDRARKHPGLTVQLPLGRQPSHCDLAPTSSGKMSGSPASTGGVSLHPFHQ